MEQLQSGQRSSAGSTPRHYILLQVLITVILASVVLGGLEFAVRTREYIKLGPKSLRPMVLRDGFTAWRNNPAYGRVDRQINAQGFRRDTDVSLEKPPNTLRIFITGGSTAYGWTTTLPDIDPGSQRLYNDQTISYYLERRLNEAFPSKRWEVINAASPSYQLNLELAQIESLLLRYRPDCIILLDGHNDFLSLLKHTSRHYDPYAATPYTDTFNLVANPQSLKSLQYFLASWARNNSIAFRLIGDHLGSARSSVFNKEPRTREADTPVRLSDLTPAQQADFATAHSELTFYPRLAQQVHRILDLDGVKGIFLLQPELFLTHKPLTDTERRMLDSQRRCVPSTCLYGIAPAPFLYAVEQLYPEIGVQMTATAQHDNFVFENLIDVFDHSSEQAFTDGCHLTPLGNRIIAERLLLLLKDMFADKLPEHFSDHRVGRQVGYLVDAVGPIVSDARLL